jgi:hypothetical protein
MRMTENNLHESAFSIKQLRSLRKKMPLTVDDFSKLGSAAALFGSVSLFAANINALGIAPTALLKPLNPIMACVAASGATIVGVCEIVKAQNTWKMSR